VVVAPLLVAELPIRGIRPPGGTPSAPPAAVNLTQACDPAAITVKAPRATLAPAKAAGSSGRSTSRAPRRKKVFQVWIGIDGAQDIQYAYRFDTISAPGRPLTVGAENADGAVGARLPAGTVPSSDLRVTSAGAQPGRTATWTVTLKGVSHGTGRLASAAKVEGVAQPVTATTTVTVER
jgi:hypothetical protein